MSVAKSGIKLKLVTLFLLIGLVPLATASIFAFIRVSDLAKNDASEAAELLAQSKSAALENYFSKSSDLIIDLAASPFVQASLNEFSQAFESPVNSELGSQDGFEFQRAEVERYYREQFATAYTEKTGSKVDTKQILAKMDPLSITAQYDFIANNQHPPGSKDKLLVPLRNSPYGVTHEQYHKYYSDLLHHNGLYDLFLVDSRGRVVYSVFKEIDFATSLHSGPWSESSLARSFKESSKLNNGALFFADFEAYRPSFEDPSFFAATPVYDKNAKFIGSVIVQLPISKVNALAGDRKGLGANGETILVGPEMKLRADTYRNKDNYNVAAFFAPGAKLTLNSEALKRARAGETGVILDKSYDGLDVLAYYSPIKIGNLEWYIVTALDKSEVFSELQSLTMVLWGVAIVCGLVIIAIATFFSGSIAKTLTTIAGVLSESSNQVSEASGSSASSATQLSESTTEQAASLQETMASVEEISAMVNQNAEFANRANSAVINNQRSSEEGATSAEEMLRSVGEISRTNDEIMAQMETSSKEFAAIVRIITDIGAKTNVINEIVFQTKLLSFNASVEAARAGEHGKGFAVVAEEIGNLAQMSGTAAKEISEMLAGSIKKVNGIVEQTNSRVDQLVAAGREKISRGQSTAQKSRESLNEIASNANEVVGMINEITLACREQAQGVEEIKKAMLQLDQVTQQNSAVAQQSSAQAEQLRAEASSLKDAVKRLTGFVNGSSDKDQTPELEARHTPPKPRQIPSTELKTNFAIKNRAA